MNRVALFAGAALMAAGVSGTAKADELLGSYVARISDRDHYASDGYALDSAAQMVRQDRANYHKFHKRDRDDEDDVWFRGNDDRARFERMLRRPGAIGRSVKRAITQWPASDSGRCLRAQRGSQHPGGLTRTGLNQRFSRNPRPDRWRRGCAPAAPADWRARPRPRR